MTDIVTSWNNDFPTSFARDRKGILYAVNGLQRGKRWDAITAAAEEMGIEQPAAGPTMVDDTGGGSLTASETYYGAYRFLDDSDIPGDLSAATTHTTDGSANHRVDYTSLSAPTETRVKFVEIYRTTAGQSVTFYLVVKLGAQGTISSMDNTGGVVDFTMGEAHNLAIGARFTASGTTHYNGTHEVTLVISSTQVRTATSFTSSDTGGTWVLEGYVNQDGDADTDHDDNAALPLLDVDNQVYARKYGEPPDFKAVLVMFQDRAFYMVDRDYNIGTVTTDGTVVVVGSGTAWTTEMAGRKMVIDGETEEFTIASVGSATSITLETSPTNSAGSLSYGIYPDTATRNQIIYSDVDNPEAVAYDSSLGWLHTVTIQQNTGDDDDITGGIPYGSFLYVTTERHIYRLSFARQPVIDAAVNLIANRGALNQRCHTTFEKLAYVMDRYGIYAIDAYSASGQSIIPISQPIQDLWRDGTIDLDPTSTKWYHVHKDDTLGIIRFFVKYTSDSSDTRPQRALVYNARGNSWWTETYPWEIGGSVEMDVGGVVRVLVGAESDVVYKTHEGTQDAGSDISFTWRGGTFSFVEDTDANDRDIRIVVEPTTGSSTLNSRIYLDSSSTAANFDDRMDEGGITTTVGSPNAVLNTTVNQVTEQNISGFFRYSGYGVSTSALHRAERFMSLELTGSQTSGDNLVIHSIEVRGVE